MADFDPHAYAVSLTKTGHLASDGQLLYSWYENHWKMLDDEAGERSAYRWLVDHDRGNVSPRNARAAHRAAILWAPPLPEQTQEVVIPCRNGYVVFESGRLVLRPAKPAMGLHHVLSCEYQPEFGVPQRFQKFLEQVLPDTDVCARVQEYAGYTLTADARHQLAQLWLGTGANGKGVLANILQELHGQVAAVCLDELDGFRLSVLLGASLIYCDEIPRARINEQLLKSMIAGERVQIDRKYREPLSIRLRGKWLVLGNHLPAITDHSAGFWRRWDIVPFTVTIPESERDPQLAHQIIQHELSGVLNWALAGLVRLEQRGTFDAVIPQAMQKVVFDAKLETNSVLAWYEESGIRIALDAETPKDSVFLHYRQWCERNGLSAMASPRFWTRLRDVIPVEESRRRFGEQQIRMCNVQLPRLLEHPSAFIRARTF